MYLPPFPPSLLYLPFLILYLLFISLFTLVLNFLPPSLSSFYCSSLSLIYFPSCPLSFPSFVLCIFFSPSIPPFLTSPLSTYFFSPPLSFSCLSLSPILYPLSCPVSHSFTFLLAALLSSLFDCLLSIYSHCPLFPPQPFFSIIYFSLSPIIPSFSLCLSLFSVSLCLPLLYPILLVFPLPFLIYLSLSLSFLLFLTIFLRAIQFQQFLSFL